MFLQSGARDEGSTASTLCGASQKMQIGAGQAGSAGESRWQVKVTFQVVISGASAGGLGVIPPAMAVTLLGHFVGATGVGWGGVHESPGVDWRKFPQEVSNMLYLGEGGTHSISLFDWR